MKSTIKLLGKMKSYISKLSILLFLSISVFGQSTITVNTPNGIKTYYCDSSQACDKEFIFFFVEQSPSYKDGFDQLELLLNEKFEVDKKLKIASYRFTKTVIYSDRRFIYDEVQEIIDGADGDYKEEIDYLTTLARDLRAKRNKIKFRKNICSID